jgi:histone-lysine N-methyltransferase SUV39H
MAQLRWVITALFLISILSLNCCEFSADTYSTPQPAKHLDLSVLNIRRPIARHASIPAASRDDQDDVLFLYDRPRLEADKTNCHWCQLAQFSTHARYPVTVTNTVDSATFPPAFRFIEHSLLRAGVARADAGFRMGCECEDDGDCEYQTCYCLQDVEVKHNKLGAPRKVNAYLSKGPKTGCLRKEILESRLVLYECHESCACSKSCSNRVVERGRKIPLEIFRTADGRGWGM